MAEIRHKQEYMVTCAFNKMTDFDEATPASKSLLNCSRTMAYNHPFPYSSNQTYGL